MLASSCSNMGSLQVVTPHVALGAAWKMRRGKSQFGSRIDALAGKQKQLERDYEVLSLDYSRLKAQFESIVQEKESLKTEVQRLSGRKDEQHVLLQEPSRSGSHETATTVMILPSSSTQKFAGGGGGGGAAAGHATAAAASGAVCNSMLWWDTWS
ncbi:unnamed protein product [Sphagnum tenellum]